MTRRYASIPLDFFANPQVKSLSSDAQLLFVWLHANPYSTLAGIYALRFVLVTHNQLGMSRSRAIKAWTELEEAALLVYDADRELVYLPGFMSREAETALKPSDSRLVGAFKIVRALPAASPLVARFWQDHPDVVAAGEPRASAPSADKAGNTGRKRPRLRGEPVADDGPSDAPPTAPSGPPPSPGTTAAAGARAAWEPAKEVAEGDEGVTTCTRGAGERRLPEDER